MENNDQAKPISEVLDQLVSSASFLTDRRLIAVPCRPDQAKFYRPEIPRSRERIEPSLVAELIRLLNGEAPWPLYLHGRPGCGKSCAALYVCDRAARSRYWTVPDWCDQLNSAIRGDDGPQYTWSLVSDAGITVLDELGLRREPSEAQWEAVERFSDRREWKPAIYVSNLAPDELHTVYGERVFDRLMCGTVFHLEGESRR